MSGTPLGGKQPRGHSSQLFLQVICVTTSIQIMPMNSEGPLVFYLKNCHITAQHDACHNKRLKTKAKPNEEPGPGCFPSNLWI